MYISVSLSFVTWVFRGTGLSSASREIKLLVGKRNPLTARDTRLDPEVFLVFR